MDELLNRFGISRETLNEEERNTLDKWSKSLQTQQMTLHDVKNHLDAMINSLEKELFGYADAPLTFASLFFRKRKERFAQARLHNYMLLRDFIEAPEKARSFVEKQLSAMVKK